MAEIGSHREGANATGEVVYRQERRLGVDGAVLSSSEVGTLSDAVNERVARPWHYLHEGEAFVETAWRQELEDGEALEGYEVGVVAIDVPDDIEDGGPLGISDDLAATLLEADADTNLDVFVRVSHQPPQVLPLLPARALSSAADYDTALAERDSIAASNASTFEQDVSDVIDAIDAAGGTVGVSLWTSGRVAATVPAGAVASLLAHQDVLAIEQQATSTDGACSLPGHNQPAGDPVPLSTLRQHTGVQDYLDAGYHGQLGSGPLLVGIHETSPPEDEACFYADFADCDVDDRLKERFECDNASGCGDVSGFAEGDEGHRGTWVSSTLLGDYQQGQGSGLESYIAPGLIGQWRNLASGFAKEAEAHYYAIGGSEAGSAAGFDCARGIAQSEPTQCAEVDVLSSSNSPVSGVCDAASQTTLEAHLEHLWDDGVLPVVLTHNDNRYFTGSDTCLVRSPADLPKAFAVGALEPDSSTPYDEWRVAGYSNRGGADITVDGMSTSDAMTLVDLVASGFPGYVTDDTSAAISFGRIDPDGPCEDGMSSPVAVPGTSFATPQVAGAALLAKHRMLNLGRTWIEYPGRLHALMLSMGDRATNTDTGAAPPTIPSCVSGDRLLCGGDKYYGFGRLHLRLQKTFWMHTRTFSSTSSDHVEFAWPGPIGGNREILKCVMQQREDMSGKTDISRVGLSIRLTDPNPVNDACEYGWWSIGGHEVEDGSSDDKHMVAVVDSDENINGKCVEVTMSPDVVSSAGSVTVHVWCYVDDELDH